MNCRNAIALGMVLACAAAIGEVVQFDLGPAVNKDVIHEAGLRGHALPFGENPGGKSAFLESRFKDGEKLATGLPASRFLPSPSGLGQYRLEPYEKKNVIELGSAETADKVTRTVRVPKGKYSRIGLLAAAVGGDVSFTIGLEYEDGTKVEGWWETDDWYTPGPRQNVATVVGNMDRIDLGTGDIDNSSVYHLYEFVYRDADSNKVLKAITISNRPNYWPADAARWGGVFAINGEKIGP